MNYSPLRRGWLLAAAVCFTAFAFAQTPASSGTGAIVGRVLNPSTGEYIRNAEVRIQDTPQVAVSEDGGYYRFPQVPAGEVTLVASYLGHETVTTRVNIAPGAPTTHDFELKPATAGPSAPGVRPGELITLGAFVVSS